MADTPTKKNVIGVGLLSGGLDSTLAAKVINDLGVEVHGLHFAMPWSTNPKPRAQVAAESIGIKFVLLQLDEEYLEMLKAPKYGYGSAFNPCIDCHTYMIKKAGQYMKDIGADFVFTGEVVGQRPMSQMRQNLRCVEKGAGLEGRLLRPLSAKILDPTVPEQEGLIDRNKLLNLSGRSRKEQMKMAEEFGIKDYPTPAGGCLLTDKPFGRRMKDLVEHGYRDYREAISLQGGRHFRINKDFRVILGRDEKGNNLIREHAYPEDYIIELDDRVGPTLVLIGNNPNEEILSLAAGFVQRFSRDKDDKPLQAVYRLKQSPEHTQKITAQPISENMLESMRI